ncbi:MAG TPA: hypothetical protein DGG95_16505 [Cytophagales bacterium]|nr:hypothetical protein [Cytophagales bacterium]
MSSSLPKEDSGVVKKDSQQTSEIHPYSYTEDSTRQANALIEALAIAKQNSNQEQFHKAYDQQIDGLPAVKVDITIGYLFSKTHKHLLLRRTSHFAVNLDLYIIKGDKLESVVNHEEPWYAYEGDTIQDVNGDDQKDFLVKWYPASGCCLRHMYNVFLNVDNSGTFSNYIEFINPTFSPGEKIVRGITYGHPGEASLYKCQWNGLKLDTIEFIFHDPTNKDLLIKNKKDSYLYKGEDGVKLKEVPKEYLIIRGYDWFVGF